MRREVIVRDKGRDGWIIVIRDRSMWQGCVAVVLFEKEGLVLLEQWGNVPCFALIPVTHQSP